MCVRHHAQEAAQGCPSLGGGLPEDQRELRVSSCISQDDGPGVSVRGEGLGAGQGAQGWSLLSILLSGMAGGALLSGCF